MAEGRGEVVGVHAQRLAQRRRVFERHAGALREVLKGRVGGIAEQGGALARGEGPVADRFAVGGGPAFPAFRQLDRLEARGLLARSASPDDRPVRRVRRPMLTLAGHALLKLPVPDMQRAQQRMLAPLPKAERAEFMRVLQVLVTSNNALSRAPSDG